MILVTSRPGLSNLEGLTHSRTWSSPQTSAKRWTGIAPVRSDFWLRMQACSGHTQLYPSLWQNGSPETRSPDLITLRLPKCPLLCQLLLQLVVMKDVLRPQVESTRFVYQFSAPRACNLVTPVGPLLLDQRVHQSSKQSDTSSSAMQSRPEEHGGPPSDKLHIVFSFANLWCVRLYAHPARSAS